MNVTTATPRLIATAALVLTLLPCTPLGAQGLPPDSARPPEVEVSWDRFYDAAGITVLCRQLAEAHPELCTLTWLGPSHQGRPMPLLTIHNPATGEELSKAAMWVDGNVHGNEVQAGETCVYLAWLLLERYGEVDAITELLDERVFYICPMINPDGRQHWFDGPDSAHSSRSGQRPTDNDGDGLFDEDGPDDLDGDGELLTMRKRVAPGTGTHRLSPDDPRVMERVSSDQRVELGADWLVLGGEGFDNDGDGRVDEDGPGGYDMNRNWPGGWMPSYVQYGAGPYPFSEPETSSVGHFLLRHPNVAAVQSFHNTGGMILRGPGSPARDNLYPSADRRVYDDIADEGEIMLPRYRSMVIHKDLYTVHGGFVDWTAEVLGIISFTNELWSSSQALGEGLSTTPELPGRTERRHKFDDLLRFGGTFVDWHEVQHPDYGAIEIGGFKRDVGRVPPPFMIQEELHRNAAFCIYHASQMPRLELVGLSVEDGPAGTRVVTFEVRNRRRIPTRAAVAVEGGIGRADLVTISGEDLTVLAGGPDAERFDLTGFSAVEHEPARILLDRGIPGHGSERVRWIVRGTGAFKVSLEADKGGRVAVEGSL